MILLRLILSTPEHDPPHHLPPHSLILTRLLVNRNLRTNMTHTATGLISKV
jgi:hypothetical protein